MVSRIGVRRASIALAICLLLAIGFLLLTDRGTGHRPGLPAALRREAIHRIEGLTLDGAVKVTEIDCGPLRAGHVACPALIETQNGSGRVVYHLGREGGKLRLQSIKLTKASAALINGQL